LDDLSNLIYKASSNANSITDPQAKAKALDDAAKLVESQAAKQLRAKLPPIIETGLGMHIWRTYLSKYFPKFLKQGRQTTNF
jgi:hypothetical protein